MARLRPLRTKEEIAAVPANESVTISLEPEGVVVLDKEADDAAHPPEKSETAPAPKVAVPQDEDSGASDLKKQLEDLRKASEDNERRFNTRIQQETEARQAAEQRAREREQSESVQKIRAEDAEYDAILNAIGAAESEAVNAQRDIAIGTEAADAKMVAEASRRLARAESRLSQLEDGKFAIERAKTAQAARAKEEREAPRETKQPTVEQYIDQIPNLMQSQRNWLKEHPEYLTDTRKNIKLQNAHLEAEDSGIAVGSTQYFTFIEGRLGRKPEAREDDDMDDRPERPTVAAPPSRSATSPSTGRASSTRITLTPEQREAAKMSGIDEITYAKNLQRMLDAKAQGLIN